MKKLIFVSVCVLILSTSSLAALETITWGDYDGDTVEYNGVFEQSDTDPLGTTGLYGAPRIDGDTLAFDNLSFFSSSNGSGGVYESDITDGKLGGQIVGKLDNVVEKIRFTEFGDATVNVPDLPITKLGRAAVANSIFIKIQEIDGVDTPDIVLDPISMVFTPQDEWTTTGTYTWSGSLVVDITKILQEDYGYTGQFATKVDFTLDNTLSTEAYNGSALIAKKETGGLIVETIPEPATMVLLGLGGLLLRRRK